jgi:hypothetical protein
MIAISADPTHRHLRIEDRNTLNIRKTEKPVMVVMQEIGSIYARWRDGQISQEDALFEIGDSLDTLPADWTNTDAEEPDA